jgi:hypothetical protein
MNHLHRFKVFTLSTCLVLITACSHTPQSQQQDVIAKKVVKQEQVVKPVNKVALIETDYKKDNTQYSAEYKTFVKENGKAIKTRASKSYHKGIQYKDFIESIAEKHDLPEEIYALAAIESDFNPKIKSSVNSATGMWQLMPALGRDMGLVVNKKVDERKDWKKSTEAALRHLGDTKERFQSDELAVLSYYSGVGKVNKAVKKNNSNDIWVLLEDKSSFGKGEREFMFKYMTYAKEFRKLNNQYDQLATK